LITCSGGGLLTLNNVLISISEPLVSRPSPGNNWNGTIISITSSLVTFSFIETVIKNIGISNNKNFIDVVSGILRIDNSSFENIIINNGILLHLFTKDYIFDGNIFKSITINGGNFITSYNNENCLFHFNNSLFDEIHIMDGNFINNNVASTSFKFTYSNFTDVLVGDNPFISLSAGSLSFDNCIFLTPICTGIFINVNGLTTSCEFIETNFTAITYVGGNFIVLTAASLKFENSKFENVESTGNVVNIISDSISVISTKFIDVSVGGTSSVVKTQVNSGGSLAINDCTFERCKGNGANEAEAPFFVLLGANCIFEITDSAFIDCNSATGGTHGLYVKTRSANDNFLFDSLRFDYTYSTNEKIILLRIENNDIPNDFESNPEFTSKFVNLCPFINSTNFIVNTISYSEIACKDNDIYVSNAGQNDDVCGKLDSPCKTITFGMSRLQTVIHNYKSFSIILIHDNNGLFTIELACEIGDITLESRENEGNGNVFVKVSDSAWLPTVGTQTPGGVFSITNTASVRFYKLIFHLPTSSNTLGQKPFVFHSSSGV
jgi:hypothetical protein